MDKRTLLIGISLVALVAFVAVLITITGEYEFEGVVIDPPKDAPPLDLIDTAGEEFKLEEYRGDVVLVFFGYTSCPDVCPSTLSDMKRVKEALGEASEDVQVVFVTVDPERDTVEKLDGYVSLFDPDFIGLTGSTEALEKAWSDYGVFREIDTASETAAGYLVNHTSRLYLINQEGELALTYSFGTVPEDIAKDVEHLITN